ncbi:MAG TPA: SUMF1/EgtB/PvdO family nonheme iron enzyme [Planctomycetota bacterium]|nr:SUMF1/EgtB/PvdO family nonheme iron enzyme [Planctomycetota bacterium]
MIPNFLVGLTYLALSPAAQTAFAQEPVTSKVAPNDIRVIQRQTTDAAAIQMQPPPGMTFIPGGQVLVGTDAGQVTEYGQNDPTQMTQVLAETPRHPVTVDPFFIDTTEVTNLQWKVFLDATGRKPSSALLENGWPEGTFPAGQENFPVSNVNIPEIREFLGWCGKRLPTEDEWTRAARGDDDRRYPWGKDWDAKLCQSGMTIPMAPVEVGQFPRGASPYGVLDMAGNVFEWVDSPFAAFPGFEPLPLKQGKKNTTLAPEFNSTMKVMKGGCFVATKFFNRIDARFGQSTTSSDAALGFRAARSLQPGLEAVRHAKQRLQPPQFARIGLDEKDFFGKEITSYDDARRVITGYRDLAFAHRAADKGKGFAVLKKDSVDNPLPLGVLATSEPLLMSDMKDPATRKPISIPAGEYTLAYKGPGESEKHKAWAKSHKDDKKKDDKDEDKPTSKSKAKGKEAPAAADPADGDQSLGAAVPWPGIGSIHDVAEDIDFPQDEDVILFYNAANAVVAWQKAGHVAETDVAPIAATSGNGGKTWTIEFSINQGTPKSPRFTREVHLVGDGLPP